VAVLWLTLPISLEPVSFGPWISSIPKAFKFSIKALDKFSWVFKLSFGNSYLLIIRAAPLAIFFTFSNISSKVSFVPALK